MSITELIEKVGVENVQVQFLHECFVSAQSTKRGAHITFGTAAVSMRELATGEFDSVCAMVWIPKGHWNRIVREKGKQ